LLSLKVIQRPKLEWFFKKPRRSSYWSSIEIRALNCVVFEKTAFCVRVSGDNRTDRQTNRRTTSSLKAPAFKADDEQVAQSQFGREFQGILKASDLSKKIVQNCNKIQQNSPHLLL